MDKEALKTKTEGKEPSELDEESLFEKLTYWFGADDEIIWKEPGQMDEIKDLINGFLKKSNN